MQEVSESVASRVRYFAVSPITVTIDGTAETFVETNRLMSRLHDVGVRQADVQEVEINGQRIGPALAHVLSLYLRAGNGIQSFRRVCPNWRNRFGVAEFFERIGLPTPRPADRHELEQSLMASEPLRTEPAAPAEPARIADTAAAWLQPWLAHLEKERRLSPCTVRNYRGAGMGLFRWLADCGHSQSLYSVDYRAHLRPHLRAKLGQVGARTLHLHASALRSLFAYWHAHGQLKDNPMSGCVLPKLPSNLPSFLTEEQCNTLLTTPARLHAEGKIDEGTCHRDQLILEMLYGGGLRVSELVGLNYSDVDAEAGSVRVMGKGAKERICPVGSAAIEAFKAWRDGFAASTRPASPVIVGAGKQTSSRCTRWCRRWVSRCTADTVQHRLKIHLKAAGLPMDATPHTLRHSFATHLLNAGCGLREIGEMMGHVSVQSTQIYTHVTTTRMKEEFNRAHPRA